MVQNSDIIKKHLIIPLGLVAVVLVYLFTTIPYFGHINNLFLDLLHGKETPRSEIVIVGIDDASLKEFGAWPWSREKVGTVIKKIDAANPAVIGVDILFLEDRDKEGDLILGEAVLGSKSDVILASKIDNGVWYKPIYGVKSGYANFSPDPDGKIRTTQIMTEVEDYCLYSFAYEVVAYHSKNVDQNPCDGENEAYGVTYRNQLKFSQTEGSFDQVSFKDVYNDKISAEKFKDKIVLIGVTTTDLKHGVEDNFIDIFGHTTPGVRIHANIINSFLNESFYEEGSRIIVLFVLAFFSTIILITHLVTKRSWTGTLAFLSTFALNILIGFILYETYIEWPFVQTSIVITAVYIFATIYKYLAERNQNLFIQQAFKQYINPDLLQNLLERPESLKLGGEKKNMTVLFSDIRGFTSLSEKISAEELIDLTNSYLTKASNVILSNQGTIDKFIGDAVMAFWNAPLPDEKHAEKSVRTALGLVTMLSEFNTEHPEYPNLKIGIGIHTGEMVVGNIGGRERFDYTVLGDNVNLASRLESLTKKYGVSILISEDTKNLAENLPGIKYRIIDHVQVKGRSSAIKIYEAYAEEYEKNKHAETYEQAFGRYSTGDFKNARKLLSEIKTDPASKLLLERIEELEKNNVDKKKWTGIWIWDEK